MTEERCRIGLRVQGRVQGVGFRPYVYRLAHDLGLAGGVGNDLHGAFIEVEGEPATVSTFVRRLRADAPPLVHISSVRRENLALKGETSFRIERSDAGGEQEAEISPDVAICADCRRELLNPADRRYRYPFINCTNCGPRYSIVQGLPYDRAQTTMRHFPMCVDCRSEYDDPLNRRFHAQPNACPNCGPRAWFERDGIVEPGDAMRLAAASLAAGEIVAIKGLGGFHLACRGNLEASVRRLRQRKGRDAKPFALMVPDLEAAHRLTRLTAADEALLTGWHAPILLASRRAGAPVADGVAPENARLGIMLPYTPLHLLLLGEGTGPLVMTSANPSDEPLCADLDEARRRLADIADGFLMHDRDIARRVDDTVLLSDGNGAPIVVRRSRGHVPTPIRLAAPSPAPVLAVGGDLKGAICMYRGHDAVLSEHLGDFENPAAFRNFIGAIERLRSLLRVSPTIVAHDLHPSYHSSRHAQSLGLPTIPVQHHHAHLAGVMAEHGLSGPVIGLAADGTGYGSDGAIWGCELMLADYRDFERLASLRYVPLAGGDAAARSTWLAAAGHLFNACGQEWPTQLPELSDGIDPKHLSLIAQRLASGQGVPTSSLGRLFDAAAFLLGIAGENRYEGEAAMRLEWQARKASTTISPLAFEAARDPSGLVLWDSAPLIRDLLRRRKGGAVTEDLAMAFHAALADCFAATMAEEAEARGISRVVLSGGCMLNRILVHRLRERLERSGLRIYVNSAVPPGDGGLALGQAAVAASHLARQ